MDKRGNMVGGPHEGSRHFSHESKKKKAAKFHVTRRFYSRESESLLTSPPLAPRHGDAPSPHPRTLYLPLGPGNLYIPQR